MSTGTERSFNVASSSCSEGSLVMSKVLEIFSLTSLILASDMADCVCTSIVFLDGLFDRIFSKARSEVDKVSDSSAFSEVDFS